MSQPRLRVPDGRQGPGPTPRPVVDALDLVVARRVVGALPGDRVASGFGAGTELAQLRPYEVGDDVRLIDPSATARTGEPHVRLHVPERILTTWIVLDVSPSMAFGTQKRLKADVAEGVVTVVSRLAVRRAGRVALVSFGAGQTEVLPPRASKPAIAGIRQALARGVACDGVNDPHAMSHALGQVGRLSARPGLVVIVSDFRDEDHWVAPLGALRARHAVVAVEVRDPREGEIPAAGRLALVDPESGRRVEVDSSSSRVRSAFSRIEGERRARVASELRRLQVEHAVLSTERDWLADLGRALA